MELRAALDVIGIAVIVSGILWIRRMDRRARQARELAAHAQWVDNRRAYELNRSTKWQG